MWWVHGHRSPAFACVRNSWDPGLPLGHERASTLEGRALSELQVHNGRIVRVTSRTATLEGDGQSWRVPFGLLRAVLDADRPAETKELPES